MSKILYIKANAKPAEESRTYRISDAFISAYHQLQPQDEIITLDLYQEGIHFLSAADIDTIFGPKTEESKNDPLLKYAYQFASADKYVIAAPMWNLGVPAIVKAYFDYISISGITFKYTAQGSVGLMSGKKAIHISARGGRYSEGPGALLEMGDRYVRTILSFYGITDYTAVFAEELDVDGMDVEAIVKAAIQEAQVKAKTF